MPTYKTNKTQADISPAVGLLLKWLVYKKSPEYETKKMQEEYSKTGIATPEMMSKFKVYLPDLYKSIGNEQAATEYLQAMQPREETRQVPVSFPQQGQQFQGMGIPPQAAALNLLGGGQPQQPQQQSYIQAPPMSYPQTTTTQPSPEEIQRATIGYGVKTGNISRVLSLLKGLAPAKPEPWKPTTREEQLGFAKEQAEATRSPAKPMRPIMPFVVADGGILNKQTGIWNKIDKVVVDKPNYQIVDQKDKQGVTTQFRVDKTTNVAEPIKGLPKSYPTPVTGEPKTPGEILSREKWEDLRTRRGDDEFASYFEQFYYSEKSPYWKEAEGVLEVPLDKKELAEQDIARMNEIQRARNLPEMELKFVNRLGYRRDYYEIVPKAGQRQVAGQGQAATKDQHGFTVGESRNANGKTYKYMGNNQWQEI